MKEKILAALRAKYRGTQNAILDRVAGHLAKTVKEDADVESAVADSEELVTSIGLFVQSEGDRRVTEALAKQKIKGKDEGDILTTTATDSATHNNDIPAWAKALTEQNRQLLDRLSSLEGQSKVKIQTEALAKILGDKRVPEKFYKRLIEGKTFKDDEDLNAFADGVVTDWNEFQQEHINNESSKQTPPLFGGKIEKGISAAVENYIKGKEDRGKEV